MDRKALGCDPGLGMTNRNSRFPEEPLARLSPFVRATPVWAERNVKQCYRIVRDRFNGFCVAYPRCPGRAATRITLNIGCHNVKYNDISIIGGVSVMPAAVKARGWC